jgi:hypothetical protein
MSGWATEALAPTADPGGRLQPLSEMIARVFRDGPPVTDRVGYVALLAGYGAALVAVGTLTLREHA